MNKGLEVLRGQSRERSDERFREIRTQRAWWESRGNDAMKRQNPSYVSVVWTECPVS